MSKFPWGKVIDRLQLDLDGDKLEVVKYYPSKALHLNGGYETYVNYHVEELHSSYNNVQSAVIAYIAYKSLGNNQHTLVSGICRALGVAQ